LVARDLERLLQRRRIVAAVVVAAGRRAIRDLVRLEKVPPSDLDRIETEPLSQEIHHALGLEVEMAARVATVRTGQALVGHPHGGIDLEVLEPVRPDEVAGGAEAASGLRAPDVSSHVVEPAVPHAEDGAVLPGRELTICDTIRAATGCEQMLAAILDPLHGHAGLPRRQP